MTCRLTAYTKRFVEATCCSDLSPRVFGRALFRDCIIACYGSITRFLSGCRGPEYRSLLIFVFILVINFCFAHECTVPLPFFNPSLQLGQRSKNGTFVVRARWRNMIDNLHFSFIHLFILSVTPKAARSLLYHPISTFDVGWQPEILSPIARLPAGLYYSIRSAQNMRALSGDWF